MFKVVSRNSRREGFAAREEWEVLREPADRGTDAANLVQRLTGLASELAGHVGRSFTPLSVDSLDLVERVSPGERLVVTASVEHQRSGRHAVSLVVRRAPRGAVTAIAVMTFCAAPAPLAGEHARGGLSPVVARFDVKPQADPGSSSNVLAWVEASALLSAQGAAGGPVVFTGLRGLSVLVRLDGGERLLLECSVVATTGAEVSVLTHLRNEVTGQAVLGALSTYRRVPR
jgi:hypothetical protein